jgi:hypothetical protein
MDPFVDLRQILNKIVLDRWLAGRAKGRMISLILRITFVHGCPVRVRVEASLWPLTSGGSESAI